jgi:hypothetical protein
MMQKSTTFTTIFRVKKCYFHYDFASKKVPLSLRYAKKNFFCSTLSEFENFLLCERILINVTTCQNEASS